MCIESLMPFTTEPKLVIWIKDERVLENQNPLI